MIQKKTFILEIIFSFTFFLILPFSALAQGIVPCGQGNSITNACTLCHLIIGIKNIVSFGLGLLITAGALAIFIAGLMYILSSGDEGAMTSAKNFLASSLKGFAIVLGAWFLVSTTMWLLSAKADLGIEKVNSRWDLAPLTGVEYRCSTISTGGQGGMTNN